MKRTTFALTRQTHIGGKIVDAGTVVAVVESEFPCDSIFSLASQMGLVEVREMEASSEVESQSTDQEQALVKSVESLATDGPVVNSPVVEEQSEATGGTDLTDAGMSDALASRLAKNDITTVEQLKKFIANDGDLVALEDIGTTYAKRIMGWFNNYNQ
jgi:hypothetical protein